MENTRELCPRKLLLNFLIRYAENISPPLERGRAGDLAEHLFFASMDRELIREQQNAPGVKEGYKNYVHALRFLRAVANSPDNYTPNDLIGVVQRVDEYVGKISNALLSTLSQ